MATLQPEFAVAVYFAYILATRSRSLTFGTTNNLVRRVGRHRAMEPDRHREYRLVYFERWKTAEAALLREQELGRQTYQRLTDLVTAHNPSWSDLAAEWFIPRRA